MKLFLPAHCNEIGQRSNNEDAIFPLKASENTRLFIVCDGVGGQAKGEVASSMVCQGFSSFITNDPMDHVDDPAYLSSALENVEKQINMYLETHPEAVGMASTLSLLWLSDSEEKALIAWVGDSRAYHIRDGEILFRTKDHSIVQGMIDMGEITEDEAQTHPKRNIITRAINGTHPTRVDWKIIDDIKKNDYFFLCTDGILETLTKEKISSWFRAQIPVERIKSEIMANAKGRTSDNYSMYIIKVHS